MSALGEGDSSLETEAGIRSKRTAPGLIDSRRHGGQGADVSNLLSLLSHLLTHRVPESERDAPDTSTTPHTKGTPTYTILFALPGLFELIILTVALASTIAIGALFVRVVKSASANQDNAE